jgi:hypothetical protein
MIMRMPRFVNTARALFPVQTAHLSGAGLTLNSITSSLSDAIEFMSTKLLTINL